MREVSVSEARARWSALLTDVERGEDITITRRGVPVARLVGVPAHRRQHVAATIGALRELRKGIMLEDDSRTLIADGRD